MYLLGTAGRDGAAGCEKVSWRMRQTARRKGGTRRCAGCRSHRLPAGVMGGFLLLGHAGPPGKKYRTGWLCSAHAGCALIEAGLPEQDRCAWDCCCLLCAGH